MFKCKCYIKGMYEQNISSYGIFTGQWIVKVMYYMRGPYGRDISAIHSIKLSPPCNSFDEAKNWLKEELCIAAK